jgi:hypothetical protein
VSVPARNQIRAESQPSEIPHGALSRFSLLFSDRSNNRNQTDVDQTEVLGSDSELELTHCFNKGSRFNVANCSTELDDAYFGGCSFAVDGDESYALDPLLDSVGDMGNNLNGLSEIITAALKIKYKDT